MWSYWTIVFIMFKNLLHFSPKLQENKQLNILTLLGSLIHATAVSSRGASATSFKWRGIRAGTLPWCLKKKDLKAIKGAQWVSHREDYQSKLQHVSALASIRPPSEERLCLRQRRGPQIALSPTDQHLGSHLHNETTWRSTFIFKKRILCRDYTQVICITL